MAANYAQQGWGSVVITTWDTGPPFDLEDVERATTLVREVAARQPTRKCSLVAVLRAGIRLLDAEGKLEVVRFYRRNNIYLSRVAHVAEGRNLWASTARNILAALRLANVRDYPLLVAGSVDEAAEWLAPHASDPEGRPAKPAALAQAINGVGRSSG